MKIVIIGSGPGGMFAAINAIKTNPKVEITIIDRKDSTYSNCGFPFVLEGILSCKDLKHEFHIGERLFQEVVEIEKSKNVVLSDGSKVPYDCLVLALGSAHIIPDIPGIGDLLNRGVYMINNPENTGAAAKAAKSAKCAVVVGAGVMGLECAIALKKIGLKVTVVEMLPYCLYSSLDKDMAKIVQDYLSKEGIEFVFARLTRIEKKNKIIVSAGKEIETDAVFMAAGVRPNTGLAERAGIKIGKYGIITHDRMETSEKRIFAVGDCVQVENFITKKEGQMRLATAAISQGKVAGTNAAGGNDKYPGAINSIATRLGELEIASCGINSNIAAENNIETIAVKPKGFSKMPWFPQSKEIIMKVLFSKKTRKILGAQVIGEGSTARINVISTAISAGFGAKELSKLEFAYWPGLSEANDVLIKAGEQCLRMMK